MPFLCRGRLWADIQVHPYGQAGEQCRYNVLSGNSGDQREDAETHYDGALLYFPDAVPQICGADEGEDLSISSDK